MVLMESQPRQTNTLREWVAIGEKLAIQTDFNTTKMSAILNRSVSWINRLLTVCRLLNQVNPKLKERFLALDFPVTFIAHLPNDPFWIRFCCITKPTPKQLLAWLYEERKYGTLSTTK